MYDDGTLTINDALMQYPLDKKGRVQRLEIDPISDEAERMFNGIVHSMKEKLDLHVDVDVKAFLDALQDEDYGYAGYRVEPQVIKDFLEAAGYEVNYEFEYIDTYNPRDYDWGNELGDDDDE